MARCIGKNELALVGGEVTVGDVNGDALFTLGAQAVGQQGKIKIAIVARLRCAMDGVQLVFIDALRVVEEPADQGGLAIIHAAGCNQAQKVFFQFLLEKTFNRGEICFP